MGWVISGKDRGPASARSIPLDRRIVNARESFAEAMMMMKDPAAAAAASALSRRPRASSLQALDASSACGGASSMPGRECCSSGSFVSKLYRMVDSEPSTIVSWIRGGSAFCIVDPKMLAEHCLPKYFRHRRFSSLIRQLNFYSFYRVQEGQLTIYQHSFFRKGRPDLLVHIKRRGAGKAKDPWFDPLAKAQVSPQMEHPMEAPAACFSPMAKPLSIENMSPALKPGTAPTLAPPAVDLGVPDKRWEMLKRDDCYPLASALSMRHELFLGDVSPAARPLQMAMPPTTTTPMAAPSPLDLDMDFLADDQAHLDTGADPRIASVARDCLKWDLKGDSGALVLAQDEQDRAFEDELLLDLATVTPEAWEVPLSPLNESEVAWGDLCF
jgi:hypothetical protein